MDPVPTSFMPRPLVRRHDGGNRATELKLTPEPKSMWSERAHAAFESNIFAPHADPQDAMAIDAEAVVEEYKYMKGRLQETVCPHALLGHAGDHGVAGGDQWRGGGPQASCVQVGPADTDVQLPLWRSQAIWWCVALGLGQVHRARMGHKVGAEGA